MSEVGSFCASDLFRCCDSALQLGKNNYVSRKPSSSSQLEDSTMCCRQ